MITLFSDGLDIIAALLTIGVLAKLLVTHQIQNHEGKLESLFIKRSLLNQQVFSSRA